MKITLTEVLNLSETRKPDRQIIAQLVSEVCTEFQIDHSWTREGFDEMHPRAHVIQIMAPQGLRVRIEIDGESCQHNVHVLCWHIDLNSDTRLADSFGSINTHHFQKCTEVAYGTFGLIEHLRQKFQLIRDGKAFSAEREADAIAKHGTAAERHARFVAWRNEVLEEKANV